MKFRSQLPESDTAMVRLARDLRSVLAQHAPPGMTNDRWAETAGVTASALSSAVSGRVTPSAQVLESLLRSVGIKESDRVEWERRRKAAAAEARQKRDEPAGAAALAIAQQISSSRELWEAPPPGDPDYRSHARVLDGVTLAEAFPLARDGQLPEQDTAYALWSAIYWGKDYTRWAEFAGPTAAAAEVLIDCVTVPFRRMRWRAAWLLQQFPHPLRDQAVTLIEEIWSGLLTPEERTYLELLPASILAETVVDTLRSNPDPDLDRGDVRISLLNEFVLDSPLRGARGRLQALQAEQ